jgi:hypothetical protein
MELNIREIAKFMHNELERFDVINREFKIFNVKYGNFPELIVEGYTEGDRIKCSCRIDERCLSGCFEGKFLSESFAKKYLTRQAAEIYSGLVKTKREKDCRIDVMKHSLELLTSPFFAQSKNPKIKRAIFNNPATIVYWTDGTKTVVKCSDGDTYSKESGLAMCFMKKMHGNDNGYHKVFKEFIQ